MSEDIHTQSDTVVDHGARFASSEVRSDQAGKHAHPPGQGDLDREALEKGRERLEQAGAGH